MSYRCENPWQPSRGRSRPTGRTSRLASAISAARWRSCGPPLPKSSRPSGRASAGGGTKRTWTDARREVIAAGVTFDEYVTSRAGEATEVAREALRGGVTRIVAVGGDGTLSEIVNGYFDDGGFSINSAAAIGLLPSGTGSIRGQMGLSLAPTHSGLLER